MKTAIVCLTLAMVLGTFQADASIVAGPIANPKNGHDYYLLSADTWTASEAEAENLGGTLAIIKNAGEQEWVLSTFGSYGGTNRNLWIGLHKAFPGGPFVWVADTVVDYSNWEVGQPDNNNGNEMFVHMLSKVGNRIPGTWNDLVETASFDGAPICGVVEVPAKSNRPIGKEKSLVGTWYSAGDRNHPCWITATGNMLFQIFDRRASRLIYTAEGSLLVLTPQHGIYGEIVKDKILWSNGTWWSRKPSGYQAEASLDRDVSSK